MKTWVALLRGINVGGTGKLPMKALIGLLEDLGARNARTYIQTGNAVFESAMKNPAQFAKQLAAKIGEHHGFEPHILVFGLDALDQAMAGNPFPEAEAEPATLHLGFLDSPPARPDLAKLESLRKDSERFRLAGQVFYLHAPEGVGRSKLAASAEKLLGVPMTDRNWRTVTCIRKLADQ